MTQLIGMSSSGASLRDSREALTCTLLDFALPFTPFLLFLSPFFFFFPLSFFSIDCLFARMLSRFSRVLLFAAMWTVTCQPPLSMDSPGKNTAVGCIASSRGSS